MFKKKNQLDEMQEQKLLHIEKAGYWFAFWGLLIAIFVQVAMYGPGQFKEIAGEWILFMCLSLYMIFACMKNGIWDRHLKPNLKTNIVLSLLASVVFSAFFATVLRSYTSDSIGWLPLFFIQFIVMFILLLVTLLVCSYLYKKKHEKLEAEDNE